MRRRAAEQQGQGRTICRNFSLRSSSAECSSRPRTDALSAVMMCTCSSGLSIRSNSSIPARTASGPSNSRSASSISAPSCRRCDSRKRRRRWQHEYSTRTCSTAQRSYSVTCRAPRYCTSCLLYRFVSKRKGAILHSTSLLCCNVSEGERSSCSSLRISDMFWQRAQLTISA